jgi:integrase/recombinase XerD
MAKNPEPYTIIRRTDSKSFRLTLNPSCGLPARVCNEWYRRSFQQLPPELANYRKPKDKPAAKIAAVALIVFLKKKQEEEGNARRIHTADITVGVWIEKFISIETSPRTGVNASKNKPYSLNTLDVYKSYYKCHIKDDPICNLKMAEVEEEDIEEFSTRLSIKKFKKRTKGGKEIEGSEIGGSRTFAAVLSFMCLTFNEYQKKAKRWFNPFRNIDSVKSNKKSWDALPEDEMLKLFQPGVLKDVMEFGVCAAMFLSGLRRGEISALRPEDLDWHTPKITVCHSWQRFERKGKILGPTKGKKNRRVPFDPILQEAIKKIWAENGEHKFVFCKKDGSIIGGSWIKKRFPKWLKNAGIELGGRRIVPHSSRHSLASLLEERGVSLRYIQELLGHSDLKTTKIYLHSTEKTIRDIGNKISEVMEQNSEQKPEKNKIFGFRVS